MWLILVFTSDILHFHRDNYKEFHDLKGHRWVYNDEYSLTGNVAVLAELKKLGESANFFGHILHSGIWLYTGRPWAVRCSDMEREGLESRSLISYICVIPPPRYKHNQESEPIHPGKNPFYSRYFNNITILCCKELWLTQPLCYH